MTGTKAETIEAAKAWCAVQGYVPADTEWERDPWQAWHVAGTMAAAAQSEVKQ